MNPHNQEWLLRGQAKGLEDASELTMNRAIAYFKQGQDIQAQVFRDFARILDGKRVTILALID